MRTQKVAKYPQVLSFYLMMNAQYTGERKEKYSLQDKYMRGSEQFYVYNKMAHLSSLSQKKERERERDEKNSQDE